jgi:hypothetical protein
MESTELKLEYLKELRLLMTSDVLNDQSIGTVLNSFSAVCVSVENDLGVITKQNEVGGDADE